jgi:hypothetical protein
MAWTVKTGIPEYVSWLESARVAILGSDYEWVGEYFWLLSERTLATAPFCAAGPLTCPDLNPLDFLGLVGAGRLGGGIQAASLGEKLTCFLQQKMFEAYCENVVAEGAHVCTLLYSQGTGVETGENRIIAARYVPPCDHLAIRKTSGPGTGGHIVYYSATTGFTGAIATGGFSGTTSDGESVYFWPWVQSARYIWVNSDGTWPDFWNFYACQTGTGEGTPYEAPPLERPPYALTPPSNEYPDIAALGAEMDNLERKLHVVIEQGITTQIDREWPLAIEGEVLPVETDEDVELVDVAGVIVTLSNIGNQTDERFGEPRELHRVGRIVFGTSAGWLAPIEITVTPQLFVGLPPGVTKVRLHLLPPTTGTMQMVKRVTPTG